MIYHKGKEYYSNNEMIGLFGSYDYNKNPVKFGRIMLPIFEKKKVDEYMRARKKRLRNRMNIDVSLIQDPLHREMAEMRMGKTKYTLQQIADKYGMTKQNVSLILKKYPRY